MKIMVEEWNLMYLHTYCTGERFLYGLFWRIQIINILNNAALPHIPEDITSQAET